MKKDMRRINDAWVHEPRVGQFFVFGKVGSGQKSYIGTFAKYYTEPGINKALRDIKHMMSDHYTADEIKKEMTNQGFL